MNDDFSKRHRSLGPLLRRDLEAYARHDAVAYDVNQGLERLTASLALASAAAGAAGGATSVTSVGVKAGVKALVAKVVAGSGLKVVAVCLAVGAAGTAAAVHVAHTRTQSTSSAASPAPTMATPVALVAPAAPVGSAAPEMIELDAPAPPAASAAVPGAVPTVRRRKTEALRRGPAAPAAATTAPARSVREEMAALVRLRALASRDPAGAIDLAAGDDARFGATDLFGEEREAIVIGALTSVGRTSDARRRAQAFLAVYSDSPFAAGVRKALSP